MNFDQWFAIATKNIAESELPKLRTELENHVLEAIAAHEQMSHSKFEAEQKAVLELGDPKIAARGFKRAHLTKREERRIKLPTVTARIAAVVFTLTWWGICEAIVPNLFVVFADKTTEAIRIFRFTNGLSFTVQIVLLAVQMFRGYLSAFQWRLYSSSLENIAGLTSFFAWTLMPVPFTLSFWLPWVVIVLTSLAYFESEIPLLRKLRART